MIIKDFYSEKALKRFSIIVNDVRISLIDLVFYLLHMNVTQYNVYSKLSIIIKQLLFAIQLTISKEFSIAVLKNNWEQFPSSINIEKNTGVKNKF